MLKHLVSDLEQSEYWTMFFHSSKNLKLKQELL